MRAWLARGRPLSFTSTIMSLLLLAATDAVRVARLHQSAACVLAFEAAQTMLTDHLTANGEITAAAYRDLLGASRKFAIALLDYFDRTGVTIRVGDLRRLRGTR